MGHHPNIIKLIDVIETSDSIYTVMEYCAGGELFDLVSSHGRLPEAEAKYFFRQIISAVRHLHSVGLAHRDLKLENILIDSKKVVKLADFGLSTSLMDGMILSTSCGSPHYAAPELLTKEELYDGKAVDMWSCGVVLYATLIGAMPFDSNSTATLFKLIRKGKYILPKNVNALSIHAVDLIVRLLQVNPVKRLTITEAEAHPW